MTLPPPDLHPQAIKEARAAYRWYARRSARVAARFLAELDRAMQEIAANPDLWSPYLHGTRAFRLHRFPYLVIYRRTNETLQVVAVMHGRRRPGYWRRRLP
jgi:plasmid stabilization system protein ParE